MVLEEIKKTGDIKHIKPNMMHTLAQEIREFLIEKISKTGGHLASNLGAVELTMALHLVFDPEHDKIIWDVGHQSYTHKLLTGRRDGFDNLRSYGGMSGFPKRSESDTDVYETGHSSTSLSAGIGFAKARDLVGEDYKVVAVVGDGAMTGGLAFEALNNASALKKNFIIVLNDNEMSISANVGGMSTHLMSLRTADRYLNFKEDVTRQISKIPNGDKVMDRLRRTKSSVKQLVIPGMIFENLGIKYLGPFDGHNISLLQRAFSDAAKIEGPVLVHVLTKKGHGYQPAEKHPARFHGTGPFDIETGLPLKKRTKANYTDVFSTVMRKLGDSDEKIVAITAAMEDGVGLRRFHNMFPDRFFDVGIAEGHGVVFAAGLASMGLKPVFAVYSSFLQRGFDELAVDVALQKLPVVFCVDRAGLVGEDGDTHQGIFDLSYLTMMPNMTVMAPKNKWELADMIKFAISYEDGPVAIRYPRGQAYDGLEEHREPIVLGQSEKIFEGRKVALLAIGSMVETAFDVREKLIGSGVEATVVNARFAKPIDEKMIDELAYSHELIVTLEDNVKTGGFGEQVGRVINEGGYDADILNIAIDDMFVPHGSVGVLREKLGMDSQTITDKIKELLDL